MKMLFIFSHKLTEEQKREAVARWEVTNFVPLPPQLQAMWSNIPPDGEWSEGWVRPFQAWVEDTASPEDCIVLVQGEFGATYVMVLWLHAHGYRACYATSKRVVTESMDSDGTVQVMRQFRHVQFRVYV